MRHSSETEEAIETGNDLDESPENYVEEKVSGERLHVATFHLCNILF